MDPFRLDGKIALITGGSRGIGLGIARAMAAAGAELVLVSRSAEKLAAAAAALEAAGRPVRTAACDMRRVAEIPGLFASIAAQTGGVDILVNNAGGIVRGPAEELSAAELEALVALNLTSVFALCQAFAAERFRSGKPGAVVNIGSIMGELARPGVAAYAMTKGGVRQLTRALAVEWAPRGIRVNAIGPGFTRSDLTAGLWSDPAFREAVNRRTPLGRWAEPEDIGRAAVFLASPAADYITGQTLYVDGGLISTTGELR
jgi:gluconate 5-dehydrogenase